MATNSRNNSAMNMADDLSINDGNNSKPPLASYIDSDAVVSNEQKRKPLKERFKENREAFKAILKTTKGKFRMAMITLATIAIVALTGTGIAAGVAAGDVNSAVDDATFAVDNGTKIVAIIDQDLSEMDSYADYFTAEEQARVIEVGTNVSNWEQKSEEVKTSIANVQANKNVFSARDTANNELVPKTNELAGIDLSADSAYVSNLLTAVQARAGQANATNQGTVQSIINGEGSYYNMDKIQDTMNQIDGYFVDADGNGTADIVETVNGIEDAQLKELANTALASMNEAKASADSTFATLQANWNIFMDHVNSGSYPTALSYYNTDIAPSASSLAGNLSTVEAGNANIANYVQNDQQQSIVTGAFSEQEIEHYAKIFENMGISGTINSIDYTYDIQTGKINMNVNSKNGPQIQSTVMQFKTDAGYDSIDVGSVMSALRNSNSVNMNIYNISNTSQYGTLTVSENGKTSTISSQFSIGYSSSVSYKNGVTMLNVKVVVQDAEGNIYNIGSTKNSYQGKLSTSEIQSLIQEISSNCVKSSGIQFLDQADIAEANMELV